jgi:hypothetical protein
MQSKKLFENFIIYKFVKLLVTNYFLSTKNKGISKQLFFK